MIVVDKHPVTEYVVLKTPPAITNALNTPNQRPPLQRLMTDELSPIKDLYPSDFAVDLEGKRADWEGVVLIPFVDEERLLAAARSIPTSALSQIERQRNTLGNIFAFRYKDGSTDTSYCISTLPAHFSSVMRPNSICMLMPPPGALPPGARGFGPQVWVLCCRCHRLC